jgi:hypothetical protein
MNASSVFVSYSHKQGAWIWERLVPVLRAAGCAEVFVDKERFTAGREIIGQMDEWQDKADVSLLVLSPEYLASAACRHEMVRAIANDPDFANGKTLPVQRDVCDMSTFKGRAKVPLWVDLVNERADGGWNLMLRTLEVVRKVRNSIR